LLSLVLALQTIEELERLKRQLRQPYSAKAQVEAAITRLERGLQIQSKVNA
jgi:hypothetical protein